MMTTQNSRIVFKVASLVLTCLFLVQSLPIDPINGVVYAADGSCVSRNTVSTYSKFPTKGTAANPGDDSFQGRALDTYLVRLLADAIWENVDRETLIDKLLQHKARYNIDLPIELATIKRAEGSLSYVMRKTDGLSMVRYTLTRPKTPCGIVEEVLLADGRSVWVEEFGADAGRMLKAGDIALAGLLSDLATRLTSPDDSEKASTALALSRAISGASTTDLNVFLNGYLPNLSVTDEAVAALFIYKQIVSSGTLSAEPARMVLRKTASARMANLLKSDSLPRGVFARYKDLADISSEISSIFGLLDAYRLFLSRGSSVVDIASFENAVFKVRSKSSPDKIRTIDFYMTAPFVLAKEVVACGTSRSKKDFQPVVREIAATYAEESLKVVPDAAFRADAGFVFEHNGLPYVFLSNFSACPMNESRANEIKFNKDWFIRNGFRVEQVPAEYPFEGVSEIEYVRSHGRTTLIMNYGVSTSKEAHDWIEERLRKIMPGLDDIVDILHVKTVRGEYTHLDMALCSVPIVQNGTVTGETIMYYPDAFDEPSRKELARRYPDAIILNESDARSFAAESVIFGSTAIIDNRVSEKVEEELKSRSFNVRRIEFSELSRAGGGIRAFTLPLHRDIFDPSFARNNSFQIADSMLGYFDLRYMSNPWERTAFSGVNKQTCENELQELRRTLAEEGAFISDFNTSVFSGKFDLFTISRSLDAYEKDRRIPREERDRMNKLVSEVGGAAGIMAVLSRYSSGMNIDRLDEILSDEIGKERLAALGGTGVFYTVVKRFLSVYMNTLDTSAARVPIALSYATALVRDTDGVEATKILDDARIWQLLVEVSEFDEFVNSIFKSGRYKLTVKDEDDPVNAAAEAVFREMESRLERRNENNGRAAVLRGLISQAQQGIEVTDALNMAKSLLEATDADLPKVIDAVIGCLEKWPAETILKDFSQWQSGVKKSPAFLFFVFYRVLAGVEGGQETMRILRADILEKKKGDLGNMTEAHHRLVNACTDIATQPENGALILEVSAAIKLARVLTHSDQLKLPEDLVRLTELADMERAYPDQDYSVFMAKVASAGTYSQFHDEINNFTNRMAFRRLDIDWSLFTPEESARRLNIGTDLDEIVSAMMISRNYSHNPSRIAMLKLLYISAVKGDFRRIRYEKDYMPPYIDEFFKKKAEADDVKRILTSMKSGRAYKVFSRIENRRIMEFWRPNHEFEAGSQPESFDDFIESVMRDHVMRQRELMPGRLREEIDAVSLSLEEYQARIKYLEKLGRALDQVISDWKKLDMLKEADLGIFEEASSCRDKAARDNFLRVAYDKVCAEQKIIVAAVTLKRIMDERSGLRVKLTGFKMSCEKIVREISTDPKVAELSEDTRRDVIPDISEVKNVVNFDIKKYEAYRELIGSRAWENIRKFVAVAEALSAELSDLKKSAKLLAYQMAYFKKEGQSDGTQAPIYEDYFEQLAAKIQNMSIATSDRVEIGLTDDPVIMIKALRGECYDYRDGLNSDALLPFIFSPLVKIMYVRDISNRDYYRANQIVILSETVEEKGTVPVLMADFFYGERQYEKALKGLARFYVCTTADMELISPIEEDAPTNPGELFSVINYAVSQDGEYDLSLDALNRFRLMRIPKEKVEMETVINGPMGEDEAVSYATGSRNAMDFYDEHLRGVFTFEGSFLTELDELVKIPSGTRHPEEVNKVADVMAGRLTEFGIEVERVSGREKGVGDHLVFKRIVDPFKPYVMLSGHMDTVFNEGVPPAEMARQGDIIKGPGVNDMKGGLVVMMKALKRLKEEGFLDEVNIVGVLNSEEETGSKASRPIIEDMCRRYPIDMAMVFEFNAGEVILARQGTGHFRNEETDPLAAGRIWKRIKGLAALTSDEYGDRVNPGIMEAFDARPAPNGMISAGRFKTDVTSGGGHAGRRHDNGELDSNYDMAKKIEAVEQLLAGYGNNAVIYYRMIKGGEEINKLCPKSACVLDLYVDPSLGKEGIAHLKADVLARLGVTFAPSTVTTAEEIKYEEAPVWSDSSVTWGSGSVRALVNGEYRFIAGDREALLKEKISDALGAPPNEPHRPVMFEYPLARNILKLVGFGGRGKLNESAADSNIIASTPNSRGEKILVFCGLGLSGDKAHNKAEFAYVASARERTDLSVALVKELLKMTALGKGMRLGSIRKVERYGQSELSIVSMSQDYARRNSTELFRLQSSDFDHFEMTADDMIADSWPRGKFGLMREALFTNRWQWSFAAIDENNGIVASVMAYEEPTGNVRVKYLMIDPDYGSTNIARDLLDMVAEKAAKSGVKLLKAEVSANNEDLFASLSFLPSGVVAESDRIVYEAEPATVHGLVSSTYSEVPAARVEPTGVDRTADDEGLPIQLLGSSVAARVNSSLARRDKRYSDMRQPGRSIVSSGLVVFSDNFLASSAIPPYETYKICKERRMPFWIVVRSAAEEAAIRELGFTDGIRFEYVTDRDIVASGDKDAFGLASQYNIKCAEVVAERARNELGKSGRFALITNPFYIPQETKNRVKHGFECIARRFDCGIAVPGISLDLKGVVAVDMLAALVLRAVSESTGLSPLVFILPPVRGFTEDIKELIEHFNAERQVKVLA